MLWKLKSVRFMLAAALLLVACASDAPTTDTSVSDSVARAATVTPAATATAAPNATAAPAATAAPLVDDAAESAEPIGSTGADELYDLIRTDDPNALACLADRGQGPGEFYDKAIDDLVFPDATWFFQASYTDGATLQIRVHPDLGPAADAKAQAQQIADAVGVLPSQLRVGIERVGILGGDFGAQGDGGGEGIHLYADNVAVRVAANRLEETIFHESVHTSLDDLYVESPQWLAAQLTDGRFLTTYGRNNPATEDFAEVALYAYALLYHPDRIPASDAATWQERIPARISFIESVLPAATNQPATGDLDCS